MSQNNTKDLDNAEDLNQGNPFIRRWLGDSRAFDDAITEASGFSPETRRKQFDEAFGKAAEVVKTIGVIASHPSILQPIAEQKTRDFLQKEEEEMASYKKVMPKVAKAAKAQPVAKKAVASKTKATPRKRSG